MMAQKIEPQPIFWTLAMKYFQFSFASIQKKLNASEIGKF